MLMMITMTIINLYN